MSKPLSRRSRSSSPFTLQPLEERRLLAWGAYPQLVEQDTAASTYPTINGSGVTIALIDSGVDFSHPKLSGVFHTNPYEVAGDGTDNDADGYIDNTRGWDFYNNDNNPEDQNGHGTAMAGIIAAQTFSSGGADYAGVARGAKIIPLKVSDPTGAWSTAFDQRIEKALQWVEANYVRLGIRVVSMSVYAEDGSYQNTYQDEVQRLIAKGLFIAAAESNGVASTPTWPAKTPGVFGVNVVNTDDTIPNYVPRAPELDLVAPGNAVPILLRGGGTGTSASASSYSVPWVAATAALMFQADRTLTATQVGEILKATGHTINDALTSTAYKRLDIAAAVRASLQTPYSGTPFTTNQRIQAEDFDAGGEGLAYHDTSRGNSGGWYRTLERVDIERCGDSRGGYDVTINPAGEWLEYTFYVGATGNYQFYARVAKKARGGTFHVEVDGVDRTGPIAVPKTAGWQSYVSVGAAPIKLRTGTHVMRIVMDANNASGTGVANFNWFVWSPVSSAAAAPATAATTATPATVPAARPAPATTAPSTARADAAAPLLTADANILA